ncbi:MAG: O-methyltransferase [Chitinophagaceae bacterium]
MELLNPLAEKYAEKYTTADNLLLQEIIAFTNLHHSDPHMVSGPLQGTFLEMISCMIRPKRILEIGTMTGFSALCLAKGLTDDGMLHTIEVRKEDAETAQGFFNRSNYLKKIIIHIGEALPIIDELRETWDLVFIDADKPNYINYFNHVLSNVRKGGFILADNVLFHGQVLEEVIKGKNARAIQAFNDFVAERTDVEKMMLPLRDGVYLIRKL